MLCFLPDIRMDRACCPWHAVLRDASEFVRSTPKQSQQMRECREDIDGWCEAFGVNPAPPSMNDAAACSIGLMRLVMVPCIERKVYQ